MSSIAYEVKSKKVFELLQQVAVLPPVKRRAVHAFMGAAVGDAAIRPFHWVYNRTTLESELGDSEKPEFWPKSVSPFYDLPTGRRSCYSDQGVAMLRSLKNKKQFDRTSFITSMRDMFSPTSEYAIALKMRKEAYDPAKRLEERQPVVGPYQQSAVSFLLQSTDKGDHPDNETADPTSKESDGFCASIPLISLLCSGMGSSQSRSYLSQHQIMKEEFFPQVLQAINMLQTNPVSVSHSLTAAGLLGNIILEGVCACEIQQILHTIQQQQQEMPIDHIDYAVIIAEMKVIQAAVDSQEDFIGFVEKHGKPCANPGCFMGGMLAVCQAVTEKKGYPWAIRNILRSGGCNCSKGNLAGACLGAAYGVHYDLDINGPDESPLGIPVSWIVQTDGIEEILTSCLALVE